MPDQKRKVGRPPKHLEARTNMTFRARAHLREWLAEAASDNCRSMSEEIERRVTDSFSGKVNRNNLDDLEENLSRKLALTATQIIDALTPTRPAVAEQRAKAIEALVQ
jgi:hypothetical protein